MVGWVVKLEVISWEDDLEQEERGGVVDDADLGHCERA